jgi:hypothetical protein
VDPTHPAADVGRGVAWGQGRRCRSGRGGGGGQGEVRLGEGRGKGIGQVGGGGAGWHHRWRGTQGGKTEGLSEHMGQRDTW